MLALTAYAFDGPLPTLAAVREAVVRVSGLDVVAGELPADHPTDPFALRGTLAFALAPDERLEVHSGRVQAAGGDARSAVILRGFVGLDGTLWEAAGRGLEALGGRPPAPGNEPRPTTAFPLTPAGFARRRRAARRLGWLLAPLAVLAVPALVALAGVYAAWAAVVTPRRVWRAYWEVTAGRSG